MEAPAERHENRIATVVERVARQSDGMVAVDLVEHQVRVEFARWRDATVEDFIPIFVERRVTDVLGLRRSVRGQGAARARARAERLVMSSAGS